ncbi:MAG: cyclase family protein [Solirubrobacterales bacterium]|jgi:kynurenine formamidase|nr:cyclase family protein [Solirubrobacterales bacterium]
MGSVDPASARVVDLSVTLSERLPCTWPGHMLYAHNPWNWFAEVEQATEPTRSDEGPYQTNFLVIDEHCGTHFDAPAHFVPPEGSGLPWAGPLGSQSGDRVPLEDLMGPAAVVDLRSLSGTGKPGESPWITPDHIRAWEAEHGRLRRGEVVLLHTGWNDAHYVSVPEGRLCVHEPVVTRTAPGWPAPHADTALELIERGVRCVGIDAPSVGAAHDGAPVHWEGLSRGLRYVEHLAGLAELPTRGAMFMFLPLKIAHSSGGPGRAVALLSNTG